jgi:hypothetical protein
VERYWCALQVGKTVLALPYVQVGKGNFGKCTMMQHRLDRPLLKWRDQVK